MFNVVYRIELGRAFQPGKFKDIEVRGVNHRPPLGTVVLIPDGSDRYGRVISIEKSKAVYQ